MSGWKRSVSILCCVGWLMGAPGGVVTAQDAKAPASAEGAVALRIELSLSRHDGDKVVSNLPFMLMTTLHRPAQIRMDSQVPVRHGDGPQHFQNVGTNIDASVESAGSGRYRLSLGIEDQSVAEGNDEGAFPGTPPAMPVIRSNTLHTTLILRDGQATELVVATDKVTGETVKAQVRVTAIE